jgi:potassium channel subfamily K
MSALAVHNYLSAESWRKHFHDLAAVAPVIAGVIAPFSVLLDIPALSERWYAKNGTPAPDPAASLVLSGVALGFALAGNVLLVVRFSTSNHHIRIRWMIPLTVVLWSVKVRI